jgi:hypothetical protein
VKKKKSISIVILSSLLVILNVINCKISDPNFSKKLLLNTTYTGFISRDFFQVVVSVPILLEEKTIVKERETCLQRSIYERDKLTIPILRSIATNNVKNKEEYSGIRINIGESKKKSELSRGEFSWFLDSMFLFKEDYSSRKNCTFVFRVIQDKLYEKVENVKLVIQEDLPKQKNTFLESNPSTSNSTQQNNQNLNQTQNPNLPNIPGVVR